jgi:hypothetical protein
MKRTPLDWLLLAGALAQPLAAALPAALGFPSVSLRSGELPHPLTPAGYAFSIWGIIFLGVIALGVARLARGTGTAWIGWPFAGALLLNAAWQFWVPPNGVDAISLLIITGILCLLLVTAASAPRTATGAERWLAKPAVMLFAGWVSAATFVNIAAALQFHDINPAGHGLGEQAVWLIGAAAIAVGVLAWRLGHWAYSGAVIWALVAISAKNGHSGPIAISAWLAIAVVVVTTAVGRRSAKSG